MIDIHSHILPGIDDGAKSEDVSLEMLKIAIEDGISDIILTPHYIHGNINNTDDLIKAHWQRLCELIDRNGYNIKVYPGSEIFICPEIPSLLDEGKLCLLNDSQYMLIELPMSMVPEYTEEVLYQVRLKGIIPIIAHPERNLMIGKNYSILHRLIEQGALAQVNSSSIKGLYGKRIQKIAFDLVAKGMVHFISSDAHTTRGRAPKLTKARVMIADMFGEEKAEVLFETNGQSVINNEEAITWDIRLHNHKDSTWGMFFKKVKRCLNV